MKLSSGCGLKVVTLYCYCRCSALVLNIDEMIYPKRNENRVHK